MLSLVRQRVLVQSTNFQVARTFLTNQQLGMDKFLQYKERNVGPNKDILVSNIKSSIEKDGFVYTEDLKGFAYSIDTPEDAKLLKDAFIKFATTGEPIRLATFKIGPVISRALYQIDDLESLKELFNNEKTSSYFQLRSAYNVFLSFLYKKEQYSEVMTVGELMFNNLEADQIGGRRADIDNAMIVYLAAANKLGDKDALDRARKMMHSYSEKLRSRKGALDQGELRLKQVMLYHMLCVKNNELTEALEILSTSKTVHYEFLNAKACVLIKLGRAEECLAALNKITDFQDRTRRARYVFTETIDTIKKELENNPHEELKNKIESLSQDQILDAKIEDTIMALPNARTYSLDDQRNNFRRPFNNNFYDNNRRGGNNFNNNRQFGNRYENRFENRFENRYENRFDNDRSSGGRFNRFEDRPNFRNYGQRFNNDRFNNDRFNNDRFNNDRFNNNDYSDGSRRPFRPFQTRFKDNNQESDII